MEKIITDQNFESVVSAPGVTLVDFWAPWCGPCRMLSPVIEEIAEKYSARAVIAKCNVDDCPDTAMKLGIMSIPTVMVFRAGQLVDSFVGVRPAAFIEDALEKALK